MPTLVTNPLITCNGPIGLPIVLPIWTNNVPTAQTSISATSLCNGTNMTGLWQHANYIIQTSAASETPLTPASWLYVSLLPSTSSATYASLEGVLFTPPKPRPKVLPSVIRAGRRAVRRSIDLYARFRGMNEVRRFMRGEEIEFEGELYKYRVKKTLKVLQQTMNPSGVHIPYSLRVADKLTGKNLASGCVIFPSLPVIDQLLALSFHIQDPEDERELIKTTNWSPRLPATPRAQELQLA